MTMITPSYLGETIEYSSLHACRSTLEDPTFEVVDLLPVGSALLVRIHHCIADGRALVALLHELADRSGDDADEGSRPGEERSAIRKSSEPTRARRFFGKFAALFRLFPLSRDPVSLLRRPLNGRKGVAWSEAIPLDPIKALAAAHGHHVADVLLTGVAGALDRYAREHGEVPRSVHALLPVAGPSEASAGELGNHYASYSCPSPPPSTTRGRGSQRSRATWRSCGRVGSRASPAVS